MPYAQSRRLGFKYAFRRTETEFCSKGESGGSARGNLITMSIDRGHFPIAVREILEAENRRVLRVCHHLGHNPIGGSGFESGDVCSAESSAERKRKLPAPDS